MDKWRNSRAVRWLLDGLLLILFIPMVIPASNSRGLVPDRFLHVLPVFSLLLLLRVLCRKNERS